MANRTQPALIVLLLAVALLAPVGLAHKTSYPVTSAVFTGDSYPR